MSERSRNWAFTWNNYDESVEEKLRSLNCKYLVAGREICPTTGTPHLQCTVVFANPKAKSAVVKLLKGAHVESCRNVFNSIEYCKKDDDALGYFEVGNPPMNKEDALEKALEGKRARNELLMTGSLKDLVRSGELTLGQVPLVKKARMILAAENEEYLHDNVRGIWYYGPSRTGKSRKAFEENPGAYRKAQNKWFDQYEGQDVIILDDLDSPTLGHHLKLWMDRYPVLGETKNGHAQLCHKKFIVTSNFSIEELFEKEPKMIEPIRERCIEIKLFEHPLVSGCQRISSFFPHH